MQIEKAFTIKAPRSAVWSFLTDPYRVARALPGAAITEKRDADTYAGTITVKVGPVSTSYRGTMRFEKLDPASGTAEIQASGQDVRGKGGAQLRMTSQVTEQGPGETQVRVVSDVSITGILAQMGRGMIDDVSNQMFQRFSAAMRAELESAEPVASTPATVGSAATGTTPASATPAGPAAASPAARSTAPTPPTDAPIEVVSFALPVLARALGRAVMSPAFWLGLVAAAALAYWLRSR